MKCRQTRKKVIVEPPAIVPYAMSVCLDRSSADSMGETILSIVRKAARLAVYDEMMISVKNHQVPPTTRVDTARGLMSDPCCIRVPTTNQNALDSVNVFSRKTRRLYSKFTYLRIPVPA